MPQDPVPTRQRSNTWPLLLSFLLLCGLAASLYALYAENQMQLEQLLGQETRKAADLHTEKAALTRWLSASPCEVKAFLSD